MNFRKIPTRMFQIARHIVTAIAVFLLLLSLTDLVIQVKPDQVIVGEAFWYWGYVNQHLRPPILLIIFVLFVIWGFLRLVWRPLRILSWFSAILLILAILVFAFLTPLRSLNTSAVHIESYQQVDRTFHLFYQSYGIVDETCVHIIVVCDRFGQICRYVDQWQYGPVCMGQFASIRLTDDGVILDGDLLLKWDKIP